MRKVGDISGGVRGSAADRCMPDDDTALSKAETRELRRRLADLKDPVAQRDGGTASVCQCFQPDSAGATKARMADRCTA